MGWVVVLAMVTACNESTTPTPSQPTSASTAAAAPASVATDDASSRSTAAPSASAAASPQAGNPTARNDDAFSLAAADAKEGVGFEVKGLANQGWTWIEGGSAYLQLSGPPGGPLGFEVRGYADGGDLAKAFAAVSGQKADALGAAEKVKLGGGEREAQAFSSGQQAALTSYCLIRIPSKASASKGLLVAYHSGGRAGATPTCAQAMTAPALEPITASFAVRE